MKVKPIPVEKEAVQWTGDNHEEIRQFFNHSENFAFGPKDTICIFTLEGKFHASKGDYIIKGIKGEYYAVKPDIFLHSYEIIRECRVCGCTDMDCRECIEDLGHPCQWVEPDLCSRCRDYLEEDYESEEDKAIREAEGSTLFYEDEEANQ